VSSHSSPTLPTEARPVAAAHDAPMPIDRHVYRRAFVLAGGMAVLAALAAAGRHRASQGQRAAPPDLRANIPLLFGSWQHVPTAPQVVNPQTQQILDALYSEVVARTYAQTQTEGQRYHVMMSVAYGNDQRGGLEAHRPEVCYPAQGFVLQDQRDDVLATRHGAVQVRRLRTSIGTRQEPITYWFAMAQTQNASAFDRRMTRLRATLTGSIPDGILMRVSSIDADPQRAWRMQDAFIMSLLDALPAATRARLLGQRSPIDVG
jgi:EpsI family protein